MQISRVLPHTAIPWWLPFFWLKMTWIYTWAVSLSVRLTQSFTRFHIFFFVFPTEKSHTRPTSINQITYSDRRFVYINNNIFYVGPLVNISTSKEIYFTIFSHYQFSTACGYLRLTEHASTFILSKNQCAWFKV